mmetsp:Transcript_12368/g.10662  ORF Transcript_12368/g.10662 Transcript_12368/m.10662 type:complete len:82 (-) Transcript_12368:1176-1421(-)
MNVSDLGITNILQSINKRPQLNELKLIFNDCPNITRTSIQNLSHKLPAFKKIQNLKLAFKPNFSKITENDIRVFSESLTHL